MREHGYGEEDNDREFLGLHNKILLTKKCTWGAILLFYQRGGRPFVLSIVSLCAAIFVPVRLLVKDIHALHLKAERVPD